MAFKTHIAENPGKYVAGGSTLVTILAIVKLLFPNGYAATATAPNTTDPAPVYVTMPQVDKRFDERMEVWDEKFKQLQRTADKTDANVERLLLDRRHADAGSKKTKDVAVIP